MKNTISFEKAAVMNYHYIFYPLQHFFDTMQRLEVKNVDLWSGYPHFFIDEDFRNKAKEICRMSRNAGTRIICCTPEQCRYPVNMAATDRETKERTIRYHLRCLEAAAALEAPMYQVVPGWGYFDQPIDDAWDSMCDSLSTISRRAGELGITVILEPLQIIESNLVGYPADCRKALTDVGEMNLKIVVDTCHMAIRGIDFQEYFDLLGDDIYHIHLNDYDQVPWGEGSLPLKDYLSVMSENAYDRYYTLEICSLPHHVNADKSVEDNVAYIRKALDEQ